jgi:cyclic pyranopterin phosphate synthase
MPPEGIRLLNSSEILSYEELLRVITILGQHGVSKVRFTGGEPLVRKGIVDFIRSIRSIGTINELAITTNGSLLGDMAHQLKAAGLDRVNISVDTVNSERFSGITGNGNLTDTLKGIESAIDAGLSPVKLNVVLTEALSEEDVMYFVSQVYNRMIAVRFIEYMPVGRAGVKPGFSISTVKKLINNAGYGTLEPTAAVLGSGPAKYYRLPGALGLFGFITPISDHFCNSCSRIRLTADGKVKPCLLTNDELDIKTALRNGSSDKTIYELFVKAMQRKPIHHNLSDNREKVGLIRGMSQIGG